MFNSFVIREIIISYIRGSHSGRMRIMVDYRDFLYTARLMKYFI